MKPTTVLEKANGVSILISYSTAVAAFVPGRGFLRTKTKWSATTSRHINAWLLSQGCTAATEVDQTEIEAL